MTPTDNTILKYRYNLFYSQSITYQLLVLIRHRVGVIRTLKCISYLADVKLSPLLRSRKSAPNTHIHTIIIEYNHNAKQLFIQFVSTKTLRGNQNAFPIQPVSIHSYPSFTHFHFQFPFPHPNSNKYREATLYKAVATLIPYHFTHFSPPSASVNLDLPDTQYLLPPTFRLHVNITRYSTSTASILLKHSL